MNYQDSSDCNEPDLDLPCFGSASSILISKESLSKLAGRTLWVRENRKSKHKYAYFCDGGHWVLVHRFLLELGSNDQRVVDHINRNTLDNRYSNLQVCSRSENQQNRRKHQHRLGKSLTSTYKGVQWHPKRNKWEAQITLQGKNKYLGMFEREEDAARAYNEWDSLQKVAMPTKPCTKVFQSSSNKYL